MKHQQDMLPRCVTPIVSHFETGSEEKQVSLFALFNAECLFKSFYFSYTFKYINRYLYSFKLMMSITF